ncbi:MAG: transcription termination/antitermination protein NusA [Pseudomonadales bacterium]|nr:transcription termination/antitermination protein NusA [Pseudomonadales bacterium]
MKKKQQLIRTEFAAAISQIANERNIEPDAIYEAIEVSLVSAYRKQMGELQEDRYYFTKLDRETGEAHIFRAPATQIDEETGEITAWDESKAEEVTPAGFGRIAAQTAKQVILQKIRESERDQVIADFQEKIGDIITAQILRMRGPSVVLDLGRGQGIMPPEEQMRGEFYRMNNRITVLIKSIEETPKGRMIVCSRADTQLVVKLFEREVPEVASGAVDIARIAREAGVRTKLAVRSTQEGVDPVGSCVGQRGVRVQEVIRELNNEKLDIIPFVEDEKLLLQGALAPAEGLVISLDETERLATVTAPDDQLSLVIGRGGQNVRLASKLTGWRITVKSAEGEIETKVTGDEEYEIDTYGAGVIDPETREILIQNKLTTMMDIARFRHKWEDHEDIPAPTKEFLSEKVAIFEKEEAEHQKNVLLRSVRS